MNPLLNLAFLCLALPQQSELSMPTAPIIVQAEKQPAPNGPPAVNLPPDFSVGVGRLAKIVASSNGKQIKWVIASQDADLIPSESGSWAIFASPNPGRYMVMAWTALGDIPSDAAVVWVTVGNPVPPPPPPPPPLPPGPPNDPWYQPISAAFATETDKSHTADLASCWRAASSSVMSSGQQNGQDWFKANVVAPVQSKLGNSSLLATRKAIEAVLNSYLKLNPNTPISPLDQANASIAFARIATILDYLAANKR